MAPLTGSIEASRGGTAVIALAGDPDVLNSLIRGSSYAGIVLAELQDALAEMGEDLEWEPRIASGWELGADRLSITYHLKPWVWSDGKPLTSRDVVSTFQLISAIIESNLCQFFTQCTPIGLNMGNIVKHQPCDGKDF